MMRSRTLSCNSLLSPLARWVRLAIVIFVGILLALSVDAEPSSDRMWIGWRNGDSLRGELLDSVAGQVRVKAKPFAKPLELNPEQLRSVKFSSPSRDEDNSASRADFRVSLINGDQIDGDLHSMNEQFIEVLSAPFLKTVRIERAAVERILQIGGNHLHYSGPRRIEEWTSSGRDRKPSDWFTDLRGAFATHQWSGNLFREIAFPKSVQVRFSAYCPNGAPSIEIGLLRDPGQGPMIETWDRSLVLTFGSQFVPFLEIGPETRDLDFRLFWNQVTGSVRLCDASGRLVGSLEGVTVPKAEHLEGPKRLTDPKVRGFSITNRTPELKLTSLLVEEWDGSLPPVIDTSRPRVLLAGQPPRFETEDIRIVPGSAEIRFGGRRRSLSDLRELILTKPAVEMPANNKTRIGWRDGSTVSGTFQRLTADALELLPVWSESPVTISLERAREIQFPEPSNAVVKGSDHLVGNGFSLHGNLKTMGSTVPGDELLGWQAPGAAHPVPFAEGIEGNVIRHPFSASVPSSIGTIGRGRLYLTNGEVLVGTVVSMTSEKVTFLSPISGQVSVPSEAIRAVDIGAAGRILNGFSDAEWEEIEEFEDEIVLEEDSVLIRGGGFGNPSLLLGDRISFDAEWAESYGAITIRLFADGAETGSPSTDLIIAAQGNRLFVGRLKDNGAFSFSGDQVPISGNKAQFELLLSPSKIEVKVNGKPGLNLAVNPARTSGNGIYFEMGGGWQGWNQRNNEVTISDFEIARSPGSLPRRIIDDSARQHALKIPRTMRSPLPTHLLVAPNGDLLRGELVAASENQIRFRSGEETLELARNRVSAVIWLRTSDPKPSESSPTNATNEKENVPEPDDSEGFIPTHLFTLMDGSRLRLRADRIDNDRFIGTSSLLGECSIAIENVREMHQGLPAGATLADKADTSLYADWIMELTPEPKIPGGPSESSEEGIGESAPPVELTMLDGSGFTLEQHRGKVVVLDFWASWCGPCIRAIPEIRRVVAAFPPEAVTLCAINQGETTPIITRFLQNREWTDLPVALDFTTEVGKAYGVEGIPHTVVIDPVGKVASIHRGFSETFRDDLFEAIAKALQQ